MSNFKFFKRISVFFVLAFVLFSHNISLAQEQGFGFSNVGEDSAECFKYYPFGKVDFTIDTDKGLYKSGESMIVSGTVNNRHLTSPVTDGSFLVQLRKLEDPYNEESVELFIDQKNIPGNIIIPPNGNADVNFTYQLPTHLPGGKYALSIFLISAGQFNIAGLPFIPNVPGDLQGFIVEGSDELNLPYFNLEESFVNGIKYSRNLPAIKIGNDMIIDDLVVVNTIIVNPASFKQAVSIEKKLFHWDDVNPDNFLSGEKESLSIAAGKQATVDFTASSLQPGVYMVVFEASLDNGAKTISRIRFALPGNRTRLIYSGFSSYPIKKGDKNQVISCFANETEADSSDNNDLEIAVSGNKELSSFSESHKIEITPSVGIVKSEYTAGAGDDLNITTQVSEDGKIIDKVVVAYRLKDFLPKLSFAKIITGIAVFAVLLIFIFWKRHLFLRSGKTRITVFAILMASGFLFFFPGQSRADESSHFFINYLMPNEFGEERVGRRAGISLVANAQLDLTKPGSAWQESQSYNLDRTESVEWYVTGGAFDSPPLDYYCNYGGGSELCKRDADNDGVRETKIIFNRISLEEALSAQSVLSKIPSNDFHRYGFLNKNWIKDSNPLCFSTPYFHDGYIEDTEEKIVEKNRVEVLCAMRRSDNDNYTILRNFKHKVDKKGTSETTDDTFPVFEDGSSIRLMWPEGGQWISNAEDMYFTTQCDYQDTYTTDNSKVSCSADLNNGKTTCVVGNGFTDETTVKISLARKFSNCDVSIRKKVKDNYIASGNWGNKSWGISEETVMTADQPPLAELAAMSGKKITNPLDSITINRSVSVTVKPPSLPFCTAKFSPAEINEGQSTTFRWDGFNDKDGNVPITCTDFNFPEGSLSDSFSIFPEADQTCVATVENNKGVATCSDTVVIKGKNPKPEVNLIIREKGKGNYVDGPITIDSGKNIDLSWTSEKATSCVLTDFSDIGVFGSVTTSVGLTAAQTYTITCYNSDKSDFGTDSAKVEINPASGGYNLTVNINADNCGGNISNEERGDSTGATKIYTDYSSGDKVTLIATPGPNSEQPCKMTGGWNTTSGGNCVGGTLSTDGTTNDTCSFTMTGADKSVSVSFNQSLPTSSSPSADPDTYNLTFKTSGSGSGNATRYAYDDTWGWTDSKTMSNGDTAGIGRGWKFKLVPNPSSGSYFSSWSGCSSVNSDNECILEKNPYPGADKTATATFNSSSGPISPISPGGCVGCSSVKAYISAQNTVVSDGNNTVVTWTSDNAASCEQKEGGSDTGWIDASDTALGNYTTSNFTTSGGPRTYKVTCVKGSQSADAEVTVNVGDYTDSPSVTMWADPQSVGYKKTAFIQWLSSNIFPNSCLLYSVSDTMNGYLAYFNFLSSQYFGPGYYKSGIGSNNTTGQATGKLTADTTYKIQCGGYGPSFAKITAQTTVTVAKPVSNFTLTNPTGASLVATIVEGLSANSGSIALTLSGEAIGNVNLSASLPAISGAKAQFSSDNGTTWSDTLSVDISAISEVKIKAIKIPGATLAGTYNTAITATDTGTGGKTKKLNVNLRVDRVSSEWKEF